MKQDLLKCGLSSGQGVTGTVVYYTIIKVLIMTGLIAVLSYYLNHDARN